MYNIRFSDDNGGSIVLLLPEKSIEGIDYLKNLVKELRIELIDDNGILHTFMPELITYAIKV